MPFKNLSLSTDVNVSSGQVRYGLITFWISHKTVPTNYENKRLFKKKTCSWTVVFDRVTVWNYNSFNITSKIYQMHKRIANFMSSLTATRRHAASGIEKAKVQIDIELGLERNRKSRHTILIKWSSLLEKLMVLLFSESTS